MVAIVKDAKSNGTVKTTHDTTKKSKKASDSDSDDDSSSEEEIKVDLKKAALVKQQKVITKAPKQPAAKVVKKESSESESDSDEDDDESEEETPVKPVAKTIQVTKKPITKQESESESEEETPVKPVAKTIQVPKKPITKQESESESEEEDEEEEEKLVIHPKNGVNNHNNGFNKPSANSKEDEIINSKLKEIATDVNSSEASEKGDFKHFNLPANLVEKLKAKKITYLYPIQIATLTHIRAGHDVIAQASKLNFSVNVKMILFLF